MKKNKLIMIGLFLLLCFFSVNIVAKASDCDTKQCYCKISDSSVCGLYDKKPNEYKNADKSKCGCKSSSGGTTATSSANGIDACQNAGVVKSFQIVGYGMFFLKIVAPIILIIMSVIEISKAIVSNDDNAIKTSVGTMVKRAIAAVVIFFIPTIIAFVFRAVDGASEVKGEFTCLSECISSPTNCSIPSNELFN